MFTINGRTMKCNWVPVLGALLVGGEKHHGVEWSSAVQAARAAVIAHPDMAPEDLQVVNDETGETFCVAELVELNPVGVDPNEPELYSQVREWALPEDRAAVAA